MRKINNKKKFIYLISPVRIRNNIFYSDLDRILKSRKIKYFQLRLKNESKLKKILIGKKIRKICKKNKVKFIVVYF